MIEPKIDIRIPWEPGGALGEDYNRIMRETCQEWVLLLDADVMVLHPSFYVVCQAGIRQYPAAGMFTCWASSTGCVHSKAKARPPADASLLAHRAFARALWDKYGYQCTEIVTGPESPHGWTPKWLAGFFMLVRKQAWADVGEFCDGIAVDHVFHQGLVKHGFKVYRLDGLYALHLRDRSGERWIEDVPVSTDYWHGRRVT